MNTELLQIALAEYGERALPGQPDNPDILQMAKDCGFADYLHTTTAWCSLFANWTAWKGAYERSKSLAARSWLKIGETVATLGEADIAIFWRGDPKGALGHVGFPIAERNGLIYVLGGNESNQVMIEGFDPSKLLAYRRLSRVTL